jgi:hypothetical protein
MAKGTKVKKQKKDKGKKQKVAAVVVEAPVATVTPAMKRRAVKENGRMTYRQLTRKVELDEALSREDRDFLNRVERAKVKMMRENRDMQDLLDRAELKRKERNETLRRLCDYGMSEREIGELIGISGPRVNQIYFGTNGSRS